MDEASFLEFVNERRSILVEREPDLRNLFTNISLKDFRSPIPFLPIRAFRKFRIFSGEMPRFGNLNDVFHFVSSGSTNDLRGKHYFLQPALDKYAEGACEGLGIFLQRFGFAKDTPIISLVPPSDVWPQSSLSAMINMFACNGFNVRYCNIEHGIKSLAQELRSAGESAIVFGTSFHHVWVNRHTSGIRLGGLFAGKKLLVIDTGGTKGRTEVFSQQELCQFLKRVYGSKADMYFLSEYGMCELASQAWSITNPHNGLFGCNPTLKALAVNLDSSAQLPMEENGFLAFIDKNNSDSFPCIITEDIGCESSNLYENGITISTFKLLGRAPDASLKGCSLNVRESPFLKPKITKFSFFKTVAEIFKPRSAPVTVTHNLAEMKIFDAFSAGVFERVAARLPRDFWSDSALIDLRDVFCDWNVAANGQFSEYRNLCKNRVLHIVASANIPISWVHPVAAAAWLGYRRVHINVPSLRSDDQLSMIIIEQIKSLVNALSPEFSGLDIQLHQRRISHPDELGADVLVVFGSDTTCRVFTESSQSFKAKLLTFGDVWNCAHVNAKKNTANEIATWCGAWLGRGCLTPIVLFVSEGNLAHKDFVLSLAKHFDDAFLQRNQSMGESQQYLHRHDLLEIAAVLKNNGISPDRAIIRGKYSWIIDCVSMETRLVNASSLPLRCGGAGLVFLLPAHQKENTELKWLGVNACQPRLSDQHMGKTWFEWLSVNLN